MYLKGKQISILQLLCLGLYYCIAVYLPKSGQLCNLGGRLRFFLCKRIFKKCGNNVNVERGAVFGLGTEIEVGNNSGLGINCIIPNGTIIGKDVMMGPNCYIHPNNHCYSRLDIPMNKQGHTEKQVVVIEDDVWIGRNVTILPGRHISKGSIIATCCCLTKDFPEYSVIGGVPSKLIKSRLS